MAISPITVEPKQKGGRGGLIGKIIGGALGVIAAPWTGGASIGAGMAAGSAIGGAADPARTVGGKPVGTLDSQIDHNPEVGALALNDGLKALDFLPPGPDTDEKRTRMTTALSVVKRRFPDAIG